MNNFDHYLKILGLEPGASHEQIREAYRDLVKVWHPDRFTHDPRIQQKAQERLKEINEAYAHLRNYRPSPGRHQGAPNENSNTQSQKASPGPDQPSSSPSEPPRSPSKSSVVTDQGFGRAVGLVAFIVLAIFFVTYQTSNSHRRAETGRIVRDNEIEDFLRKLPPPPPPLIPPTSTPSAATGQAEIFQDSSRVTAPVSSLKPQAAIIPSRSEPPPRAEAKQKLSTLPPALTPPTSDSPPVGQAKAGQNSSDVIVPLPNSKAQSAGIPRRSELPSRTEKKPTPHGLDAPIPQQGSAYFTVESSWDDVLRIQGTPDRFTKDSLHYGTSDVLFANGRVVGWYNGYPKLKVRLLPSRSTSSKPYFTLGSTWDEVLTVQGTPDRFTENSLHYGTSDVLFRKGTVVNWYNGYPKLKVQLQPLQAEARPHFTVGSTIDEVLAVQGTPDRMSGNGLHYGTSDVLFENGKVVSWYNGYPKLKVRLKPRD